MAILSCVAVEIGAVDVNPREWRIETNNTFAQVSATGYLTEYQSKYNFLPTDFAQVYTTDLGTIEFAISVSNGVVSLSYNQDSALVTVPTVTNNFVLFSNTEGHMKDSGLAASAADQDYVAVSPGGLTPQNLPKLSDANGTLADSGIAATNVVVKNAANTMAAGSSIVAAKATATEAANAVTASAMSGVITTTSLTTVAGSSFAITWTNTFITSGSVVLLSPQGGTNSRRNFTMVCIPGAGTATLTIYNTEPTNAFNGTIIIGFTVL